MHEKGRKLEPDSSVFAIERLLQQTDLGLALSAVCLLARFDERRLSRRSPYRP